MPFYAAAINPAAISGFDKTQTKKILTQYNEISDAQLKAYQNKTQPFNANSYPPLVPPLNPYDHITIRSHFLSNHVISKVVH